MRQRSVSCTDYFSLGYTDPDVKPLDTNEASSSLLTWLFISPVKTRKSGRGFGWEQKAAWTWLRKRQKATKKIHWRVLWLKGQARGWFWQWMLRDWSRQKKKEGS